MFGVDPDHHNGSAEWIAVVCLLGLAMVSSLIARAEWRHPRVAVALDDQ